MMMPHHNITVRYLLHYGAAVAIYQPEGDIIFPAEPDPVFAKTIVPVVNGNLHCFMLKGLPFIYIVCAADDILRADFLINFYSSFDPSQSDSRADQTS